jgi:hypothetical protein
MDRNRGVTPSPAVDTLVDRVMPETLEKRGSQGACVETLQGGVCLWTCRHRAPGAAGHKRIPGRTGAGVPTTPTGQVGGGPLTIYGTPVSAQSREKIGILSEIRNVRRGDGGE